MDEGRLDQHLYSMLGMCAFDEHMQINLPHVLKIKEKVLKLLASGSYDEKFQWCSRAADLIRETGFKAEAWEKLAAEAETQH